MTADTETIHAPGKLGPHELVLLHGQPGSPADWLLLAGRLPAQLNAVAADRPGYGSSQQAAGGFAANARALLDDLGAERAALRRRWVASADDYGCALSILDRILHGPVATTHGEREGRPATAALASHRALSACGQGGWTARCSDT